MNRQNLVENIRRKKTFLCVGLDTDPLKIPAHLADHPDTIFEFNRAIIDATAPYCVAYKPNMAFYESFELPDGTPSKEQSHTSRSTIPTNSSSLTPNEETSATLRDFTRAASSNTSTSTPSP